MSKTIYYLLFVAVVLLGVGGLVSWAAAFWMAAGLGVSIGTHALAAVTANFFGHVESPWVMRLLVVFPILSIALALTSAIMLGRLFGWAAGVASLVLYCGYFAARA